MGGGGEWNGFSRWEYDGWDWEREEGILLGRPTIFGWVTVGNELSKSGAQRVLASHLVRHNYKSLLIGCTLDKDDFQLDRIFLSSPSQFGWLKWLKWLN